MTGPPPPPGPPGRGPGEILRAGWARAAIRAVIAFALVAVLGQGLAFLQSRTDPEELVAGLAGVPSVPGQPAAPQLAGFDIVRTGALTFYQFHNVAIEFDFPTIPVPVAENSPFSGIDISLRFSATFMLGAFLALGLLFMGGRAVAGEAGGPGWARPIHGAKVGVIYAALALVYSFLARISIEQAFPGTAGGSISAGPAIVSAVWWPLLFGLVAGVAGGISSGVVVAGRWRGWDRRVRAVVYGGWQMAAFAVALSLLGFLIVAGVHPEPTDAYFGLVEAGDAATGASIFISTVLVLPNAATGIAAASMGGSMGVDLFGSSCALISYSRFPLGAGEAPSAPSPFGDLCEGLPIDFGIAPIGYFLFLLVPIASTLLGGIRAARRAEAATPGDAAAVGALAGVVFAVIILAFMILARFAGQVDLPFSGFLGGGKVAIGPNLLSGTFLALVWGAAGGALGGLIGSRRREPHPPSDRPPQPDEPPPGRP